MIKKNIRINRKGTVLFTIVVIMMVMIITVMTTMVVVSAAQKQALNNFTDSQSYVTAKNVLDIYTNCLTNTDAAYNPMREALIGVLNPSAGTVDGGLKYPIPIDPTDDVNLSSDTLEVTVDMLDGSTNKILGLGQIVDGNIKVQRLGRTSFKVSVTVRDGTVFDGSDALTAYGNSERTVTKMIKLIPGPSTGFFDSSLVALSGSTTIRGNAQLFGGYVNTSNAVTLDSNARYIGNFYSYKKITNGAGMAVEFYLGSKRPRAGGASGISTVNYIESSSGIDFGSSGTFKVINYINDADPTDYPAPYIYASHTPAGVKADFSVGDNSRYSPDKHIGASGKPIDIYCEGDARIYATELYGNVYCLGNVYLDGATKIYGNIQCSGSIIIGGSGGAVNVTGTQTSGVSSSTLLSTFPQPYKINTYPTIPQLLNGDITVTPNIQQMKYNRDSTFTVKDCFDQCLNSVATISQNSVVTIDETTAGFTNVGTGADAISGRITISGRMDNSITTIKLGAKDMFIELDGMPYGAGNGNLTANSKIFIEYDPTLLRKDCGNVYFMLDSGTNDVEWKNIVWGATTNYVTDSATHKFGTKDTTPEEPSHFYLLVNGTGGIKLEDSGTLINGYVYAPEMKYSDIDHSCSLTGDIHYDGLSVNTDNKFNISNAGGVKPSQPAFIGSCISAQSTLLSQASSIFIEPHGNIFSNSSASLINTYKWQVGIYNNH